MQPELVDEFSIDPKQGRFISDMLLLLLGGSPTGHCSTPRYEQFKKKKKRGLWQAPLHTAPQIYTQWVEQAPL